MGALRAALLGTLAVAAWAAAAGADEPSDACVSRAIDAVESRYHGLRDLRAHFEQTTRSVALGGAGAGSEQVSAGTVQFAKPGRMRWSYETPEPSLVVSDGHTLWIYDPVHREAQSMPMEGGTFSGAAIQFLLGEGDVRRDFRVTPKHCDDESAVLLLAPREPATYETLEIRVDPASGDVLETQIADLLGNVTRVVFSDLESNLDPAPGVFTFEAPAGVRVIDLGSTGAPEPP